MRKMTDRERMQNYLPEHREAWRRAMQEYNDRLIRESLLNEQGQTPKEHAKPTEADGVLEGQRDGGEEKTDQRDNHEDEGS